MLNVVKRVLAQEAEALKNLSVHPPKGLEEALAILWKCKGRVVVSGVGKSALIGQKMVATFNSTGTPSLFIHAADALHGDLGAIGHTDVIILLSKSGDTDELKALVPILQAMGISIIAITCAEGSFLSRQSNAAIILHMEEEADPNNLAPTVSTLLQLAIGDALAIALLEERGFTKEHFAKFHPGGNLGKQLYTRVAELMHSTLIPFSHAGDSLAKVINDISAGKLGATAILTENHRVAGLITDGDLRRLLLRQDIDLKKISAEDIMTSSPKTIPEDAMAIEAFNLMRKYSITQLPVVNAEHKYVGIIHIHDLLREGFC